MNRKISTLPAGALACLLALVSFAGDAPAPAVRVDIRDSQGNPVEDAVASLHPLDREPQLVPPAEPVSIVQRGQEFQPYVTPVVVGTRVRFPNEDSVQHHVFSLSRAMAFDLPLYRGEPPAPIAFERAGIVSLGCNIHDWMSAYVVVLATPHFGRSGAEGEVSIDLLPAGRYRLEVWHPRLREPETREIVVDAGPTTQVISVTLGADRRIRRAPDSGPGGYR
jgi:plastocyanin